MKQGGTHPTWAVVGFVCVLGDEYVSGWCEGGGREEMIEGRREGRSEERRKGRFKKKKGGRERERLKRRRERWEGGGKVSRML